MTSTHQHPVVPVLSLQLANISKNGESGRESLMYMWTVFTKCRESIQDGQRLENLSWRLWYEDMRIAASAGAIATATAGAGDPLSDPEEEDESETDSESSDATDSNDSESEGSPTTSSAANHSSTRNTTGHCHAKMGSSDNSASDTVLAASQGTMGCSNALAAESAFTHHLLQPSEEMVIGCSGSSSSDNAGAATSAQDPSSTPCISTRSHTRRRCSSPARHSSEGCTSGSTVNPLSSAAAAISTSSKKRTRNYSMTSPSIPHKPKKEKRAFSFIGGSDPSSSPAGEPRIRTHSQLTPNTVQRIIGKVLPMDFMTSPRPVEFCQAGRGGTSTSLTSLRSGAALEEDNKAEDNKASAAKSAGETNPSNAEPVAVAASSSSAAAAASKAPARTSPTPTHGILKRSGSGSVAKAATTAGNGNGIGEHGGSLRSDRSFVTVTSTVSPPSAPQAEWSLPPAPRSISSIAATVSGDAQSVDSTVSAPVTSAASSMTLKDEELLQCASAHNSVPNEPTISGAAASSSVTTAAAAAASRLAIPAVVVPEVVPSAAAAAVLPPVKRTGSNHRLAAPAGRPALLTSRSKSAARVGKSALLQRSQSAKSVRIIPDPTNGHDEEDRVVQPEGANDAQGMHHQQQDNPPPQVKRNNSGLSSTAGKRVGSSSRLHAMRSSTSGRNGSSSNLSATVAAGGGGAGAAPQGPQRITSSQGLAEAYARANAIAMKRSASAANVASLDRISSEPRSVSRGFTTPEEGAASAAAAEKEKERAAALQSAASSMANNNPYAPQNSPSSLVPESVVLPPQPRPSPAAHASMLEKRGWSHSSIKRPSSPPIPSALRHKEQQQQAVVLPIPKLTRRQATEDRVMTNQAPPPNPISTAVTIQQQQQQQAGKKKGMFFLSSPTTDSDDESFGGSASAAVVAGKTVQDNKPIVGSPLAASEMHRAAPASSSQAGGRQSSQAAAAGAGNGDEDDDDDAFEDEDDDDDDDSDWSSEGTDSSAEEREAASRAAAAAAAIARAQAEKDRDMFAKRVPSAIMNSSGLLSRMLHPEEYGRGSANLPLNLRRDQSAMELTRQRPPGTLQGLDRQQAHPGDARVTVTGMQASKSTAALSGLGANRPLAGGGVNGRSGNALTRLAGPPSGVELESDDSDSEGEEDAQLGSGSGSGGKRHSGSKQPTAAQLAHLMQRTKSATNVQAQKSALVPAAATPVPAAGGAMARAMPGAISSAAARAAAAAAVQHDTGAVPTPRTIRRNMLSNELTESLRIGMLLERQSRPKPTGAGGAANGLAGVMQAMGNRFSAAAAARPAPPPPPATKVQKGDSEFVASARVDREPPPGANTGRPQTHTTRTSTRNHPRFDGQMPPSALIRRNSDPSANQTEYYSPGFHHVGW